MSSHTKRKISITANTTNQSGAVPWIRYANLLKTIENQVATIFFGLEKKATLKLFKSLATFDRCSRSWGVAQLLGEHGVPPSRKNGID